MKYIIEYDIFRMFPDLRIGIVLGRGLRIRKYLNELANLIENNTRKLLERMENEIPADFINIKAWQETYRQMGLNHKKRKSLLEVLVQRIIKGRAFPVINTAVNAYLAAALLTLLPISGFDLAAVNGDISLRISGGGEHFDSTGGGNGGGNMEFTDPGEIVYSDKKTILTRYWNYHNSKHSKITEHSTDIILASEAALEDISTRDLIETLVKIVEYESTFCKGTYSTFIIDNINPEVELG